MGDTVMNQTGFALNWAKSVACSLMAFALLATWGWAMEAPHRVEQVEDVEQMVLRDVNGKLHRPFGDDKLKGCVLIFVSPDCPIANAFQPELGEIYNQFGGPEVSFFLVYCCPDLKLKSVQEHVREFKVTLPAILDEGQQIGQRVQAKVTPEAIVLNGKGEVVYRGMINNLYAGYGKKRIRATEHYLRDACQSICAGKTPERSSTKAIGCLIYYPKPHAER
jgi:hypothetical protein